METHLLPLTAALAGVVVTPVVLGGFGEQIAAAVPLPQVLRRPRVSLQMNDRDYGLVHFGHGEALLSEATLNTLVATWEQARGDATLKEVLVIAYGDADYPRLGGEHRSRQERRLAQDRADTVRAYLEDLGARHVVTYSMAKRAGWLQDLFYTAEAQLKREVVGADDSPSDAFYQEVGQFLEAEGGPGKVFVVLRKDMLYAH